MICTAGLESFFNNSNSRPATSIAPRVGNCSQDRRIQSTASGANLSCRSFWSESDRSLKFNLAANCQGTRLPARDIYAFHTVPGRTCVPDIAFRVSTMQCAPNQQAPDSSHSSGLLRRAQDQNVRRWRAPIRRTSSRQTHPTRSHLTLERANWIASRSPT